MRKFLAILVLIGLGVGFYFYIGSLNNSGNYDLNGKSPSNQMDILVNLQEDYNGMREYLRKIQKNAGQIATFNSKLTQRLYSGELTEDEVLVLVRFQREYFSEKLLENNPEEIMAKRLLEELERYDALGLHMIGYEAIPPEFVGENKDTAIVKVKFYLNITSEEGEVYKGYVYKSNDQGLWELAGFTTIDEFPIVD